MPQDWKTNINNLVVVWQGSSWSVIAPDGHVLFRHWSKQDAYEWAEQCVDYASDKYQPYQPNNKTRQTYWLNPISSDTGCLLPILAIICGIIAVIFPRSPLSNLFRSILIFFAHPVTIPVLIVSLVIIFGSLKILSARDNYMLRKLIREPLMFVTPLLGRIGLLSGAILVIFGIFTVQIDIGRIIVVTMIWHLLCYFTYQLADSL